MTSEVILTEFLASISNNACLCTVYKRCSDHYTSNRKCSWQSIFIRPRHIVHGTAVNIREDLVHILSAVIIFSVNILVLSRRILVNLITPAADRFPRAWLFTVRLAAVVTTRRQLCHFAWLTAETDWLKSELKRFQSTQTPSCPRFALPSVDVLLFLWLWTRSRRLRILLGNIRTSH